MTLGELRDKFVDCGYEIISFVSLDNEYLSFTIRIGNKEISISF